MATCTQVWSLVSCIPNLRPPFGPAQTAWIKGGLDSFANKGRRALFAVTDAVWVHSGVRSFCKGQLQFTRSSEGMEYIRILAFGDYSRFGGDAQALESALDIIFDGAGLKALIIDVRLSFGGDDGLGRIIAARLTDRRYRTGGAGYVPHKQSTGSVTTRLGNRGIIDVPVEPRPHSYGQMNPCRAIADQLKSPAMVILLINPVVTMTTPTTELRRSSGAPGGNRPGHIADDVLPAAAGTSGPSETPVCNRNCRLWKRHKNQTQELGWRAI